MDFGKNYEREEIARGRYRQTLYQRPVAVYKNGTYQRISNAIGNTGDAVMSLGVDELFQFRVRPRLSGNAPVVHFGRGKAHIRFTPLDTANVLGVVDKNTITYYDAWRGADLRFTISGHILRKDILLKPGHPRTFEFRIDEHGGFDVDTLSAAEWRVLPPTLEQPGKISVPLKWVVSQRGGKFIMAVVIPDGDYSGWVLDPTLVLQPDSAGKDAWTAQEAPTTNFGTDISLSTGCADSLARNTRSYIEWDLSSVPSGATINTAELGLYLYVENRPNAHNARLHRVTASWSESTITWNTQAAYDATVWATTTVDAVGAYTWTGLATLVQNWLDGVWSNYGMVLKRDTEGTTNDQKSYGSSDNTTASYRPKLTLDYTGGSSAFIPRVVMF